MVLRPSTSTSTFNWNERGLLTSQSMHQEGNRTVGIRSNFRDVSAGVSGNDMISNSDEESMRYELRIDLGDVTYLEALQK